MIRLREAPTSLFASVLEDLGASNDEDSESHPNSAKRSHSAWMFALTPPGSAGRVSGAQPRNYCEELQEAPPLVLTLDEDAIHFDLGLTPHMTAPEIAAIRRRFALCNHPDRLPLEHSDIATQRMMIANAICDRYLQINKSKT
jgi:hypothetical protein